MSTGPAMPSTVPVALRCQIRIDPRLRRYAPAEAARLGDLFGEPSRWGSTLQPLQLATVSALLPPFTGSTTTALAVPLTYDLEIAVGKYFHALTDGEVPLLLLFSGSVYYAGDNGVQVGLVPWHEEAEHRLPVAVWRAAMDEHFPDSTWIRVRRGTADGLAAYRSAHTLTSWDDTVQRLLKEAEG